MKTHYDPGLPVKPANETTPSLILLVAILVVLSPFPSLLSSSAAANSLTAQVNVQSGQYLKVSSPKGSNISLVSISGGGQYQLTSLSLGSLNLLQFTPANVSTYNIVVNVTSNATNYVLISKESPGGALDTVVKNVTNTGSLLLTVQINSTAPILQNSGWSLLFGMTGLKLQVNSFSFNNALEFMFVVGIVMTGLGIAFRSRVSYLGIAFLFLIGSIVLGLLMMFGIIIAYLLSFAIINLMWKIRTRKMR